MIEDTRRVTAAQPADLEPLTSVMVLAFATDPVPRWMYHDPQRYLAFFGRFIGAFAGKALPTGTAWRIGGNLGGAFWLPPGVEPDKNAIASVLEESVPRELIADVNAMFAEMAVFHPQSPHWYLPTVGIEPHLHRMGLGSALLAEALQCCDREHMPAYLEFSNPANTAFYQRLGFEALGVIRVDRSPAMVPMLRIAR